MTVLRNSLLVPERYSNRFSSNPHPLNGLQFYVDLWNVEQQGVGTLTNGTGVATPTSLGAGANTVTVTTEGTFTIWLPDGHTGTAASGTATVTGSPVSLSGNSNTITVVGTGTITVTCTDQVVDRSTNAALCTVTGATWGNQGRAFETDDLINIDSALTPLASTTTGGWIIWAKLTDATPVASQTLIAFGDTDAGTTVRIRVNTNGTFIVDCLLADVNKWTFSSDAALISDNTWFQVALVQDGVSPVLYFNGQSAAITYSTQVDKTVWFSALTGLDNGRLGCRNSSSLGNGLFLTGSESEVILYSRNPSAQEIWQTYLATK